MILFLTLLVILTILSGTKIDWGLALVTLLLVVLIILVFNAHGGS